MVIIEKYQTSSPTGWRCKVLKTSPFDVSQQDPFHHYEIVAGSHSFLPMTLDNTVWWTLWSKNRELRLVKQSLQLWKTKIVTFNILVRIMTCSVPNTGQRIRLNPRTSECLQCPKVHKEIIHFCIAWFKILHLHIRSFALCNEKSHHFQSRQNRKETQVLFILRYKRYGRDI